MGKLTVEMLAKYGVKAKPKSSMFKNWDNPSKWRADKGNVARGVAGVATLGQSEVLGVGDDIAKAANNPRKVWDDLTGKTAADKAAEDWKEIQEEKQELADETTAATDSAVDAAQGYIQAGSDKAVGALDAGQQGGLDAIYTGRDQAAGVLQPTPNRMSDLYNGQLGAGFETDPGYQFRMQQGEDAIMRNFAARGGRGGGAAMKAILEHGQNFAANEYQNYVGRQLGMAQGADQTDFARNSSLAGIYMNTGQGAAGIHTGTGSQVSGVYQNTGNNLAGVGMQGAGINAGVNQSVISGMAPPPQNQNPSWQQQALGIGAAAVGTIYGGPAGGALGYQLGSGVGGAVSQQNQQPPDYYV